MCRNASAPPKARGYWLRVSHGKWFTLVTITKSTRRRLKGFVAVFSVVLLSAGGVSLASPEVAMASAACADTGTPLGDTGTSSAPVLISSAQQLAQLSKDSESANLRGYYKLSANIELGGCAWVPIGNYDVNSRYFSGTIDGGGFRVTGLNVSGVNEVALIGRVFQGRVKDLFLDNVTVVATGIRAGAFAGTGNQFTLERVRATGSVTGVSSVGGLVGIQFSTPAGVSNSYSLVNVSSSGTGVETGGLIGHLSQGVLTNNFSAGAVAPTVGDTSRRGGLIGFSQNSPTITASFYDQQTSGQSDTGKGTAQTTAQMKSIDTFVNAGWDIRSGWVASAPGGSPLWGICSQAGGATGGYPFLLAEYSADPCVSEAENPVASDDPQDGSGGPQVVSGEPRIGFDLLGSAGRAVEGTKVDMVGLSLPAGSQFFLRLFEPETVVVQGVVSASGNLYEDFRLPGGLAPGTYTLEFSVTGAGMETLALHRVFVVSDQGTFVDVGANVVGLRPGAVAPERLAYTGLSSSTLPWWALVLFATGLLLVLYSVRARHMVAALEVQVTKPVVRTPWEVLSTPIRVPGIDYVPGSTGSTHAPVSLAESIRELDIALSRLVVRKIDSSIAAWSRGF
jgi:hypothetical protein